MSTPRITVIGSALSGNKGAAAMLESAVQTLGERLGEVEFTLLSMYPEEDRAQNPYPNLEVVAADPKTLGVTINSLALAHRLLPPLRPLLRRHRAIRALAQSDALLDQGGITFTDGREKFLLYNVASILPALNLHTPVFKCAQAVGPFKNPINRIVSKVFLPKAQTLVTRGRITHEFAEGLGLTNLVAGADYAFSLEMDGTEEQGLREAGVDLDFFADGEVVGVCPSVVLQKKVEGRGDDYVGQMIAFIERLRRDGKKVLLVPHSVRTGTEKTHNNDLPLCTRINDLLVPGEDVLFVDRELSSQQLRHLIGRCDLFVASRFHAMVSSLAMAVPTLVIGWSHKYREVLEMFALEEWAFGHDQLTPEHLWSRFEDLSARRDEVQGKLDQHLPEVKRRSLAQADLIAELVTERAAARGR
ncbi:polysaccharide pyruvyl transferase family protein [Brachybacterium saurashtrense]|uniref:Polysaccharide pyruvyl transferase family protein n=1 Tax=Brachybacterium saurashtrense TaxID=556288 RepID=A0A345YQ78_9MICO|nr:polysaccharide pyruvyl transferase family protein [Brachybacterium saurashtrense]AXK46080.1 polysaccharide pyruvyl transferase family protein [Brachybacterium saurashtrense]RRR23820.1 polysaccharide pyruvyl transferase family protein [Brachybacterium saurashtrense]